MDQSTRILVVDDDPALRWTTTRVLTRAGYKVEEADTGEEGLRLAGEWKPDLVLLDVVLPGIDGVEVCRRIKADPTLDTTYVLLFSGRRIDTLEQAAGLEVGADGYIIRPVSNRELVARVEAILRLKQAEDDLRARTEELAQRVRELDCLYAIAHLPQQSLSLSEILHVAANLLPPAWRYPEVACACIRFNEVHYRSDQCLSDTCDMGTGCRAFARIAAPIVVGGQTVGGAGVCYKEPRPKATEGPFSHEERQLIEVLAAQLGRVIEQVQAEEALLWSEERFRAVFEQARDGIALVDHHGLVIEWNQAMERMTGRPSTAVVGRPLWEVELEINPADTATPERRHALSERTRQALETGRAEWLGRTVEHEYHHPDGSTRILAATFFRIETSRRFLLGNVVRDVTQRRRAETALARESGINAAMAALASALIRTVSIDDISDLVLERARHLTDSPDGFAGYIDSTRGHLVVPAMTGAAWEGCHVEGADSAFEHSRGLWGWVIEHRQALLTNTPSDDPRSVGTPPGHIRIHRFLAVPAIVNEVLMGEIALANADRDYTEFDLELVQRLASLYAVAIQRAHTEQALRDSEQRFRSLLESAPDSILLIDTQGRIVFANAQAEASFGYARAELLGREIEVLVPEKLRDAQARQRAENDASMNTPPKSTLQALHAVRKDGTQFPVDVKLSPLSMDADRLITAIVRDVTDREEAHSALQRAHDELETRVEARTAELAEANRDLRAQITRRREAELALRASEERFRQLAANIDQALWMTDTETGEFLYVSPVFQQMAGISAEQISSDLQSLILTVHPGDRDRVATVLSDQRANYDLEFRLQRQDGNVRSIRVRTFPIRDQRGRIYRIAGLAQDVTTERQAQAAMIQNERLAMAGKLAASLAHEINNPLQSAIGCLDLAEESLARGEDPGHFLAVVQEEMERTARIVAQLRTLSRPAVTGERAPVDLNELISEVLVLATKQLDASVIRVRWNLADALPKVTLAPDEMRQVFLNLVLNAVDAMPEGGVIEVSTAHAEPGGVAVRLVDSGGGISPDVLKQLFDPFYTTKPDGLGLGLFITQELVRAHGGRISVDSPVGEGATFTVWLPLETAEEEDIILDSHLST